METKLTHNSSCNKIVRHTSKQKERLLGGILEQFYSIIEYRFVITNLLFSLLTNRYRGSTLGVAWSLLNPMLRMLTLALIFPLIMRFQIENYVVYLFSGILAWGFIMSSITEGSTSILRNETLLKKVYLPKIIFPFVTTSSELVNFLLTAISLHIIGFILRMGIETSVVLFLVSAFITYIFCLGIAAIMSVVVVFFRDMEYLIGVVMQSVFYLTPILYPAEAIPPAYKVFMDMNPFYHFVRLFQIAIYNPDGSSLEIFLIPLLISLVTFLCAMFIQWHFGRNIIYRF